MREPNTIPDDAGAEIRLRHIPLALPAALTADDPWALNLEEVRRRCLDARRPVVAALVRFAGWMFVAAGFGALALVLLWLAPTPAPAWLVPTLTATLFLAGVVGAWAVLRAAFALPAFARYRRSGRYERDMNRLRRCLACGYSLLGLEADGAGLRTCPECAARWRLTRPDPAPMHPKGEPAPRRVPRIVGEGIELAAVLATAAGLHAVLSARFVPPASGLALAAVSTAAALVIAPMLRGFVEGLCNIATEPDERPGDPAGPS